MTDEKRQKLSMLLEEDIRLGNAAGAQAAVYEHGEEVYYGSFGMADREKNLPMKKDTICRMYSMTKPVTAAGIRILMERGLLAMEDPVEKYLPEFADMQVLEGARIVPAKRSIMIQDLLCMTSGIVYPDEDRAGQAMDERFAEIENAAAKGTPFTTAEVLKKISGSPLCAHPGERWRYGLSADVLGGVIQVITGKSLGRFFQEELFAPLEMEDTGFYVPKEKQDRFAQLYKRDVSGKLQIDRERHLGLTLCLEPPAYEAGGAGLVSTLEDYSHFARMLASGGVWKGRRILEKETAASFARNMLSKEQTATIDFPQMKGYGYGNLMRVNLGLGSSSSREMKGEFGWDGWTGPYFTVDLAGERVFLYLVQLSGGGNWQLVWKMRDVLWE